MIIYLIKNAEDATPVDFVGTKAEAKRLVRWWKERDLECEVEKLIIVTKREMIANLKAYGVESCS